MFTRLATLDDAPRITEIYVNGVRTTPWHQAKYPWGLPPRDDYAAEQLKRIVRSILDPRFSVWVAIDDLAKHRATWKVVGEDGSAGNPLPVVGVLIWERHGLGDHPPADLPPAPNKLPDVDEVYSDGWDRKQKEWIEELLGKGPFLRGDLIHVAKEARKYGAASKLCSVLAAEAEKLDVPVYTEATCFGTPFHERWSAENGYKIKVHGTYAIKSKLHLSVHFRQILKDDSMAEPKEAKTLCT